MDPNSALQKANEEVYKQNFELTIRNKTLSVLRSLYASTASTLEVNQVAQSIVDTLAKELTFAAALIHLVDETSRVLRLTAITQSPPIIEALKFTDKTISEMTISLDYPDNLLVNVIKSETRQVTGNILDIFDPLVSQETADRIDNATGIRTLIVYPLTIDHKKQGTLTIALTKRVDDLSRTEKESLEEIIGLVSLSLDRARLHEALRHANEHLVLLDKLKDEFVSVASHELRTPMTAIKSYTWLVLNNQAGDINPKAKSYIDRVYQSTERLIHLVNEMLDVSRIESGRVRLKIEPVDLAKLASTVQDEFKARSAENKLTLDVQITGTLPSISTDGEKVHQILENLIGNSFKYTPPGGQITVTLKHSGEFIEISITDTGRGISAEDLPRLFRKFGLLENSLVSLGSSTGLGLFICKQYTELLGGQIEAKSELGKGSTFTFTLPVAKLQDIN